jgi:hypothetical protein
MTAALADHFPGVEVDDVAVVLRDDGTIGPNLRNRCSGGSNSTGLQGSDQQE